MTEDRLSYKVLESEMASSQSATDRLAHECEELRKAIEECDALLSAEKIKEPHLELDHSISRLQDEQEVWIQAQLEALKQLPGCVPTTDKTWLRKKVIG